MSEICNIKHPLKREGTTQHERFPEALASTYVKVDEQTIPQLVSLSHAFAKYVQFYPTDGSAAINWQPFLAEIKEIAGKDFDIAMLEGLSQTKPHIALFLAFLRLFGFAQNNINELSGKHLNFYYKEILQLKERAPVPDKVALFFELEKNIANKKIEAGTLFKAGKDDTGKELYYKLSEEILVSAAKINSVKTLLVNKNSSGKTASVNIAAGQSAATQPWISFGDMQNPVADIGFMISSPALNLPEGNRTITLTINGLVQLPPNSLTAEYTTAKAWAPVTVVVPASGKITIVLDQHCDATADYNPAVHLGNYTASAPVLRITLNKNVTVNNGQPNFAYDLLKTISLQNAAFTVKIAVTGVRKLSVESDTGTIETAKPFFPFGATPVTGSGFYIGYPLAFNKYLQSFSLHYNLLQPVIQDVMTTQVLRKNLGFSVKEMLLGQPDAKKMSYKNPKADAIVMGKLVKATDEITAYVNQYSFGDVFSLNKKTWHLLSAKAGRNGVSVSQNQGMFTNEIAPELTNLSAGTEAGFIKITLTDDNLDYEKYLKEFTKAITSTPPKTPPEKPAVPKITDMSLDYTLQLGISDLDYFHVHPFGFEELQQGDKKVIPVFDDEGNLFIGISNFKLPGLINLYFQIQEDSGDVNKAIQKLSWYCLKGNNWNPLQAQQILHDSTQGLTQSGIIAFNLVQATADNNHSILDDGLVWLKASVPAESGAYPQMISIKAQAAMAVFEDRENDPGHLRNPLAAETITKFLEKPDGIKAVTQAFESFGGKMKEETAPFLTRVSERLRHKQRAWNIWDYERIILENFPFVYKAKCISHTTEQTEFAPGHATIIVIPSLVNVASYNKLQPRVSVGNLQKINEFINRYRSPFAKIKVINPVYEKIRVEANLVLHPQFNDEFYANELKRRITGYLAPWINNDPVKLSFDGSIHRSSIIDLLDESEYVDYISDFKMIKLTSADDDMAAGMAGDEFSTELESNILTSAGVHIININRPC